MPQRLYVPQKPAQWKPPVGSKVDPTHPLAKGLILAFLLNEGAGKTIYNAVVEAPARVGTLTSSLTWGVERYGEVVKFPGTASQDITYPSFTFGTNFTLELMLHPTTITGSFVPIWTDSGNTYGLYIDTNDLDFGATGNQSASAGLAAGGYFHVVMTHANGGPTDSFFINGVAKGSGSAGGAFGTPAFSNIGGNSGGGYNGSIAWIRAWNNRLLTQAEAAQLYQRPFDMFVNHLDRIRTWAILGAFTGGGGSTPAVPDSATGSETPTISAQIPVADSGAATESVAISASFPLSDSGAGGAETITIGIPVVDSASGAETVAINASLSLSDSATGTDTPTVTAQVPLSDSASGTDTPSINVSIPLNDSSAGSDAINVTANISVADSASGSETPTITAQISISDAATGAETQSITVTLSVADAGSGSESVSVNTGGGTTNISLSDSAAGTETPAISANVPAADSASGTEVVIPTILVTITDNATGVETRFINVRVPLSDTGAGADNVSIPGNLLFVPVADAATGADIISRLALSGRSSQVAQLVGPGGESATFAGPGGVVATFTGPGDATPAVFVFE
jgi:hypothetical protein